MSLFADLITLLGRNYILVVVGCIEVVAAVVLLGYIPRRRRRVKKQKADFSVSERLLLQELSEQKNEVCIALRRSDLMPTEVIGALEPLLGVTPSRLSEDVKSMLGCAKNHDDEAAFWKKYEAFDGGEPFEFQFETKDGLWLFLTAEQSRDKTTNLLIFRNITEEHKREEQYKRCLDDAEKASQFKTSFLFRMSHEIRTPMNGITGMIKLAKDSLQENHPAMQYLRRTDELSDHLLSLINDILDMSRIEAGKVELEEGVFSLKAFGDKLYNMLNKTLDAKGVKYNVNFESVTVDRVVGDELRIPSDRSAVYSGGGIRIPYGHDGKLYRFALFGDLYRYKRHTFYRRRLASLIPLRQSASFKYSSCILRNSRSASFGVRIFISPLSSCF